MRFTCWLSGLLFAAIVFAAEPPTELKIETTYLPKACEPKAQKGDSIQVHYVGTSFLCYRND